MLAVVGVELIFPNGTRLTLDKEQAARFRRLAVRLKEIEALELKLKPLWAKMGLPDPSDPRNLNHTGASAK